jgi:hypothetical protein
MASLAISSATQSNEVQGVPGATAAAQPVHPASKAVLQPDTLKLSPAAQARMMHRAGQSLSLIAGTLGTSVASVDGYLGITVAKPAAAIPAGNAATNASRQPDSEAARSAQPSAAPPAMNGKK